jgi:hypothetical protein
MRIVLALVIIIAGLGGGLALGFALRPEAGAVRHGEAKTGMEDAAPAAGYSDTGARAEQGASDRAARQRDGVADRGHADTRASYDGEAGVDRDYVKVGRQIVIPVVEQGETRALMLFDLAVDVPRSMTERAYAAEPRLRDAFLRELFEMSYTGAFSSTYTDERVVEELRGKLRAAARRLLGREVAEVLILDIMRQEF